MPTSADFLEMARGCYIEWTDNYKSTGVKGVIIYRTKNDADKGLLHLSSGYQEITSSTTTYASTTRTLTGSYSTADTHIFMPLAGFIQESSIGNQGVYWSSSWTSSTTAKGLGFISTSVSPSYETYNRYEGFTIRPVYNKKLTLTGSTINEWKNDSNGSGTLNP